MFYYPLSLFCFLIKNTKKYYSNGFTQIFIVLRDVLNNDTYSKELAYRKLFAGISNSTNFSFNAIHYILRNNSNI